MQFLPLSRAFFEQFGPIEEPSTHYEGGPSLSLSCLWLGAFLLCFSLHKLHLKISLLEKSCTCA